uniref:D-aminoacyl-tRNA deacylase n=1 Tax=Anabas testudineus TaxID=64144 RepID=A0A3Q1IXM7_ANATE
ASEKEETSAQRPEKLQARTIIQQCTQAKVRIRPALDGSDAQWAEIQEGMVVYVCFFDGATEGVTYEMGKILLCRLHCVKSYGTVVLFVPQDSLVGEPAPKEKMQYKDMCEPWWGAQLFSSLVSTCMDLMSDSVKCKKAGVKVEQGVYGQKQEIVLNSVEPLTVLLEF